MTNRNEKSNRKDLKRKDANSQPSSKRNTLEDVPKKNPVEEIPKKITDFIEFKDVNIKHNKLTIQKEIEEKQSQLKMLEEETINEMKKHGENETFRVEGDYIKSKMKTKKPCLKYKDLLQILNDLLSMEEPNHDATMKEIKLKVKTDMKERYKNQFDITVTKPQKPTTLVKNENGKRVRKAVIELG